MTDLIPAAELVGVPMLKVGDYVLRVPTDAMAPLILADDHVIVVKADKAEDGRIVVALFNDEAVVRRYYRGGDTVRLTAENSTVEDISAPAAEVRVLGVVTGQVRSFT